MLSGTCIGDVTKQVEAAYRLSWLPAQQMGDWLCVCMCVCWYIYYVINLIYIIYIYIYIY